MAEATPATEQHPEVKPANGGMLKKMLIFGVPAFLIQLVVIYFLTAKFVVPMTHQSNVANVSASKDKHEKADPVEENANGEEGTDASEEHIYVVKDLIINPAGTNGQRYLLTTIAFNLSSEEGLKDLEKKEMAVRDLLNSVLTSKGMDELINVKQRESLRQEIAKEASGLVNHGKLTSVYFSKYIIQ